MKCNKKTPVACEQHGKSKKKNHYATYPESLKSPQTFPQTFVVDKFFEKI